jgi:hypothetical protein
MVGMVGMVGVQEARSGRAGPRIAPWALMGAMALAGGACAERDPHKPLSEAEGASLMRDVRGNRVRAQDLTPAERMYLKQQMGR